MQLQQNVLELIAAQQSLHLSTLNPNGTPQASYAPYGFDKQSQQLFVMLSGLSAHTHNLIKQPIGSVMIIVDESNSEQIFARQRISYQINATIIKDEIDRGAVIAKMHERFGDIINMLASLPDFQVFALTPQNGTYIEGFGRAFTIASGFTDDMRPAMEAQK